MRCMEVSELVRSLLAKRGVESADDIAAFLNPDYELHTHDPFLLQGMDVAVGRVLSAMEQNERIAVYADFDCDGIPGAAVLSDFFRKIGYENFEVYLPHRDREGYGFHLDAISALAGREVKLIITVDVGITAAHAVAFAKGIGVDVIVTDHHEVTGPLPDAIAVLNPKLNGYPFPHLCGAAVAFKFVQATLAEGRKRGIPSFVGLPLGWEKWLLDLVAIATVADMVPLVGENRVLTHWGLQVLRKSPRAGISALCNAVRIRKSEITEDDIGFSIAPRVNAASRMGEPQLALRLLTTQDADEAEQLAAQLGKTQREPQGSRGRHRSGSKKAYGRAFSCRRACCRIGKSRMETGALGIGGEFSHERPRGSCVSVGARRERQAQRFVPLRRRGFRRGPFRECGRCARRGRRGGGGPGAASGSLPG